jgi:hypothetical protein
VFRSLSSSPPSPGRYLNTDNAGGQFSQNLNYETKSKGVAISGSGSPVAEYGNQSDEQYGKQSYYGKPKIMIGEKSRNSEFRFTI